MADDDKPEPLTAHALATVLLAIPDVPIKIGGWNEWWSLPATAVVVHEDNAIITAQ